MTKKPLFTAAERAECGREPIKEALLLLQQVGPFEAVQGLFSEDDGNIEVAPEDAARMALVMKILAAEVADMEVYKANIIEALRALDIHEYNCGVPEDMPTALDVINDLRATLITPLADMWKRV